MNGYKFTILPIARGKNRNISFVEKDVFMAGAYYHQEAFKRFCAEADDGGFIAEYELNNPHDENAIALKNLCGETLGYVPREIAFSISLRSDKNSLYIRPRYKKWTS